MLGESKAKIYNKINSKYIPKTYKLSPKIDRITFTERLQKENISFPFILKPDIGERGWMVKLIKNETDLNSYLITTIQYAVSNTNPEVGEKRIGFKKGVLFTKHGLA
tara:strand:- start:27 stop:347 length:321 start_codon:yes stop_codon:yes gene_type:complete